LSQGIIANGLVFVSGQVHANADLKLIEGSTADKVEQIMSNIKIILEAAGSKLDDIVKVVSQTPPACRWLGE
jgi:2-iminobutanoate/2-iminopropanoate deaminase